MALQARSAQQHAMNDMAEQDAVGCSRGRQFERADITQWTAWLQAGCKRARAISWLPCGVTMAFRYLHHRYTCVAKICGGPATTAGQSWYFTLT
jgi:hypothetical protein